MPFLIHGFVVLNRSRLLVAGGRAHASSLLIVEDLLVSILEEVVEGLRPETAVVRIKC